ncbi:MAG: acyl-CoA dehydrogenase family protein [Acidimicrobiales bacterium]|nr:acyl-CoA dehydrogenase family protein [Acidimicrobiales bacterium]
MEVTLSDDQEFFRDTTRRFLATECPITEVRALASSPEGFDRDYWRQGAELGWTSLLVPEDLGGGSISGSGVVDLTVVADAFGRLVAPGPLLPTNVVAAAVARAGSDEQRAALLEAIVAGELVTAWCGAEHAVGVAPSTAPRSERSGDDVVITGSSTPVEAAAQADHLLVTTREGDGLAQYLVPADTPGVEVTALEGLDLVRRYARVDFDGATVPASAAVGTPASVAGDVERQLQLALVVQSAEMVGAADRTFEFTVEWAFDRYSFGRPLASYQELKHRFADMKMWLEASHALAAALAREVQADDPGAPETASATKAYLGEHLAELMQDCVQMHGGIGLTSDHDIHLYLRRVVADRQLFGTPADHRERITAFRAGTAA